MPLPPRLLRLTRWKPLVLRIPHRLLLLLLNLLLILAVFVLNCLRLGTNPLMARCTAVTVPLVWCIRMARWLTLPTTLTPLTHRVKYINHVSSHTPPVCFFFPFVSPGLGNHVKDNIRKKRLQGIRLWVFFFSLFVFPIHCRCRRLQVGF